MPTRDPPPARTPSVPLPAEAEGAAATLTVQQAIERAVAAYQQQQWVVAERLCRAVLDADAGHFDALHVCGIVAARSGRTQEAADLLQRAVAVDDHNANAHYHLGIALGDLQRRAEALESYDRALALRPDNVRAWINRGIALASLRRHDEALASYDRALRLQPDYAEAWNNRGIALRDLERHAEALDSYEHALRAKPDYPEAVNNRGVTLSDLRRHAEALDEYARALLLKPDYAEAWNNRGIALAALQRHPEALEAYERALALKPDYDFLYGRWLHARMKVCDWRDFGDHVATLESKIERREKATAPFPLLALTSSPATERMAAEIWVEHKHRSGLACRAFPDARGTTRYGSATSQPTSASTRAPVCSWACSNSTTGRSSRLRPSRSGPTRTTR